MSDYAEHPELPQAAVERSDVPVLQLGLGLLFVLVLLAGLAGLVAWLYPSARANHAVTGTLGDAAGPALQQSPRADMARLYRGQMARLNGVWWSDPARQHVHLPIGDAMRRLVRDGIPDWPTTPSDPHPRDPLLRQGSPAATTTEHGLQRNVVEDALQRATSP